jgi:uncharacterized protein YcbK (DUF882 family)
MDTRSLVNRRSILKAASAFCGAAAAGRAAFAGTSDLGSGLLAQEPQFPLPEAPLEPERCPREILEEATPAPVGSARVRLYNVHTEERIDVVYRQDGRYLDDAMAQISRFLRDWRSGTIYAIDPKVVDILSGMQAQLGRSEPLYITSGYRTQATNLLLASMGYEVARNSLHLRGQAIDCSQPGADLDGLRTLATQMRAGGVGYYPTNGFIHVDCGPIRHWTGGGHVEGSS